jgi:MarR family transcriptional regulator, lower aerobic nicotinate degradation pathway regulator
VATIISMKAGRANPSKIEAPSKSRPKASDGEAYDYSEQVGHLLRKAYQRHLGIFEDNVVDPQLTSVQFSVLCALYDLGPSSQADLVRASAIDQATIRGIVQRLEQRKLVTLTSDKGDRRKVILSLTDKGAALTEEMMPRGALISELTMSGLNPAERIALTFLLRKIMGE